MANTTAHRRPPERHTHVHYEHYDHHCPAHCRYCGPDAEAWDVGEIVVGLLAAVAAVLGWLVRRPAAVLALAVIVVAVWLVAGPG